MRVKTPLAGALVVAWMIGATVVVDRAAAAAQIDTTYTVVTRDARRPLAVRRVNGQDMVALDELAAMFTFTVREDALAGGLTVTYQGQTIVLSPGQPLASVGGRLIALPVAAVREGRSWLVPVEFLSRALGPAGAMRVDVRKPSRLVLVGDLRVPRVAMRYDAQGNRARLTFDVEPPTPHRVTQEGGRLIVTFEADALDARLAQPGPGSLAASARASDTPAAIVVELGPAYTSFRTSDLPGAPGPARFVVELVGGSAEPSAPTPGAPAPEPPPLIDLAPPAGLRTIVIDPGHGGDEEGARGPSGTLEKDVTLAVARRLKAAIEGRLGIRVLLTRDADQTVSLDERAARANNNKADLFLSLHANASPRGATTGAEVFFLSLDEYGSEALRVAQGEGQTVPVFGGGAREIELILWEMAQARYIEQSASLAGLIEEELRKRVPMSSRAIQQAPFRVLVGANMPAVLVELGFITNAEEERLLTSDPHQSAIAQALVDAVVRFRDAPRHQRP